MRPGFERALKVLVVLSLSFSVSGCGEVWFGSFAPPFEGTPLREYVQRIPVKTMVREIECELKDFLTNRKARESSLKGAKYEFLRLDESRVATVTLNLQTDLTGSVTYTGIDLKKAGLSSLAPLVAITNKLPTLQLKLQPKSTVSAQVDFNLPQSVSKAGGKGKTPAGTGKTAVDTVVTVDPGNDKVVHVKPEKSKDVEITKKDSAEIITIREPAPSRGEKAKTLGDVTDCPNGFDILRYPRNLYLAQWLNNFFDDLATVPTFRSPFDVSEATLDAACITKLTLKTTFAVLFDVNGGANLGLFPSTLVVPLNGINADFSPAYTHSLSIQFALAPNYNKAICKEQTQRNI